MTGTYPNLDAADLELRVRTYLNEVTADFFTQADIWRWLSLAVKDIAQASTCIRRVVDVATTANTRTVTTNCYKAMHVEYVPSSGRPLMLTKIDPLKLGHYPLDGATPQYWYEYGVGTSQTIGIEPLPTSTYQLRLYIVDTPKMCHTTYPITNWSSGWTAGTGWTADATSARYSYATTAQLASTSTVTANTNYTLTFTVSNVSNLTSLAVTLGGSTSCAITTNGYHTINLPTTTTSGITFTALTSTGTGTVTIDDLYILKEADFSSATDQTELPTAWQHLVALYATHLGLIREKRLAAAQMLASIYSSEVAFLRQNIVEVLPDGKNDIIYR